MKKLLYIYVVLQVAATAISFFLLLSTSLLLALLELAVAGLGIVPVLAIIHNLDDLEQFRGELSYLQYKVMKLEEAADAAEDTKESVAISFTQTADNTWVCVKCNTVNKPDTTRCAHCGAAYSLAANPTDLPYTKRKRSRWIK